MPPGFLLLKPSSIDVIFSMLCQLFLQFSYYLSLKECTLIRLKHSVASALKDSKRIPIYKVDK